MAPGDHYTWSGWRAWLHALFQRRSASNQAVTDWAGLQPNMDVLDVGCGAGSAVIIAATMLPNGTAVGVDPSADFIKIAKRRSRHAGNVDFVQSTAEDLPFGAESFDVVWSVHSAHHWRDVATGYGRHCGSCDPAEGSSSSSDWIRSDHGASARIRRAILRRSSPQPGSSTSRTINGESPRARSFSSRGLTHSPT